MAGFFMPNLQRVLTSVRRLRRRRLRVEALEPRMLLDAEGVPWSAPNLTISFAPDGTNVAGDESTLFQTLDGLGASAEWQAAIVRGFDTWAQHTAASVSTRADSGDAFGAPGLTQSDPRFGDVRVAAIPMANDIIAMSVPHDEVISGTWAGDILFNSHADLNSIDDIFSIAVHEAGHVFGLGHSTDVNSPMYLHAITSVVTPTAEDIQALQRLYGAADALGGSDGGEDNVVDPNKSEHYREHEDDALSTANGLMLAAQYQGAIRYDANGQIFDATDVDFFQLPSVGEAFEQAFEQADVLTVSVRAAAPGGLIPTASILDESGRIVESTVLANANGQFVLQARDAHPRKAYFVAVKAADTRGGPSTGAYDFAATFGTREVVLERIAKGTVKPEGQPRADVLHVSETRLLHFVLAADPLETATDSVVWTAIYDAAGNPVFRAAARPGESRSANTLLLTPGDYQIQFHSDTSGGAEAAEIDFQLLSRSISIPIGPVAIDPTNVPILLCTEVGADPNYCYPVDITVTDPIILPEPTTIPLPEPVVVITPPLYDPTIWYWDGVSPPSDIPAPIGTAPRTADPSPSPTPRPTPQPPPDPAPTPDPPPAPNRPPAPAPVPIQPTSIRSWQNPASPRDVNGDGVVSPHDALAIINDLNANGPHSLLGEHPVNTPFLDVNNDHFASSTDALRIINALNRLNGVPAEGESGLRPLAAGSLVPSFAAQAPLAAGGAWISAEPQNAMPAVQSGPPVAQAGPPAESPSLRMAVPALRPTNIVALEEAIQLIAAEQVQLKMTLQV